VREPVKPVEIVFDNIRRRVSILPVGVDVIAQTISPDGKSLLLTATAEGQQNLYIYSLDELSREPAVARQLTSTPGGKSFAQFTPDSKEVFYLEQGRITSMPIETRQARPVAVTAELDVDFDVEKIEVFARHGPTCATASTTTSSTASTGTRSRRNTRRESTAPKGRTRCGGC
jgi:tricorn protease